MVNLLDFILEVPHFKTLRVDEVLFARYQCLADEDRSAIWSHTHYLAYVLNGEKAWEASGRKCRLGSGDALFVRKGTHTVYQYFEEPFFVLFIFLPDTFLRQALSRANPDGVPNTTESPPSSLFPISINAVLRSYFQSLLAHFLEESEPPRHLIQLKLEELLIDLVVQEGNAELKAFFGNLVSQPENDLLDVMEANYREPFSIADFARLSNRSLSTFRRDFKRAFRTTPWKWLKQKRLEFAREQMETTSQTVGEVFLESGFSNRSHFIRSFRDAFGKPPGAYRKAN